MCHFTTLLTQLLLAMVVCGRSAVAWMTIL
jgi:hypothetical protein